MLEVISKTYRCNEVSFAEQAFGSYIPKVSFISDVIVYSSKNNKSMRLWYNPYYVDGWVNFWVNIILECMHEVIMKELSPLSKLDEFYGSH